MQLIESAESDGAKIPLGDKQITHHTVIGAHILTNVHPEMKIWHEETFAPVLALTTFSTDDEAVVMANDTDTSLCASIFSRDVMKALAMGRKLRTGSTHINGPTIYIEPTLPNGGTGGDSGYGRFGGAAGIKEFTEERIVTFSEPGQKYPLVKS